MNQSFIEYELFSSSETFLNALLLRNKRWQPTPTDWIFRGQARFEWKLIPSVLRNLSVPEIKTDKDNDHPYYGQIISQIDREIGMVYDFVLECDHQGLLLPEQTPNWLPDNINKKWDVHYYYDSVSSGLSDFPAEDLRPVFALAQHYGIPTRLLDWTTSPMIAAYFAAIDAIKIDRNEKKEDVMSVWCFNIKECKKILELVSSYLGTIKIVHAPKSSNPNLAAQKGLFTLIDSFYSFQSPFVNQINSIESILDNIYSRYKDLNTVILRQIKIPYSELKNVLKHLNYEGYNATHLFPGYIGAAKCVLEKNDIANSK